MVHRIRIIQQDQGPMGVVVAAALVVVLSVVGVPYLDEELQKREIQDYQVRLVWDRSRHMVVAARQTDSVAPEACPPDPMPVDRHCLHLDRCCVTVHVDTQLI